MSNQLFHDNLSAKTQAAYNMVRNHEDKRVPQGQPIGVNVILPCSECGRELTVQFPWNEIATLLGGGQVQGMVPDGRGWTGQVYCPGFGGSSCTSMGGRTVVTYRVFVDDFQRHVQNFQAGRRPQVPQQQPPQQQPVPQPPQQQPVQGYPQQQPVQQPGFPPPGGNPYGNQGGGGGGGYF
jgi:hypothetical protein